MIQASLTMRLHCSMKAYSRAVNRPGRRGGRDEELLTAVRELRTTVAMTVPVEQIIGHRRAVRASRRVIALAAIVAVMAAAVFAVTTLLPS